MKLLEDRILRDGKVRAGGILKVDAFLNHQMDVELFCQLAKAWHEAFQDDNVTKILTIEASGIGLACIAAQEFGCPVLFAKKTKTKNIDGIPPVVSVSEAANLARKYSTERSADFVNGVLGGIINQ